MVIRGSHGLWVLKDIITFERCNIFFSAALLFGVFQLSLRHTRWFFRAVAFNPGAVSPFVRFVWTHEKTAITVGCEPINWIESWLTRSFQTKQGASFGRRSWSECGTTIPALRQFCEIWIVKKKKKTKWCVLCMKYAKPFCSWRRHK